MITETALLKRQIRHLQIGLTICIVLIASFVVLSFTREQRSFDVIRAKGIVIEDSTGKDRILIGAPIPASASRVRTDTVRAAKYWSRPYKNVEEFMKAYRSYNHNVDGIVVMNENGFDRVVVGDKLPDPNTGKKLFESAGILFNDREGWERAGGGVNTTKEGKARAVYGLDDPDGEAVHLVTLEDGTKGLIIAGQNGMMILGMSNKPSEWFQNKEPFSGIRYFDTNGKLLWEQKMIKK
ncbi:MAG TPA: hypothetical protein VGE66_04985 [Chitinophagaceae bacterium]